MFECVFKRHVRKILLCECVGQSCEKGSCMFECVFKRHVRKILLCECVGQSCEKGSCSWNVRVCFEKAVL